MVLRIRSSRIVFPACGQSAAISSSSKRRSGPRVRGDELEKRRDLRLQGQLRHLRPRRGVRLHDSVGACEHELALGLARGGARDDHQVRPLSARRERDVEILGIGVGRGEQPARAGDPDPFEALVVRAASLAEEHTVLPSELDRLVARVEHDVSLPGGLELLRRPAPDAPVAADDEVILDRVDHASPFLVLPGVARDLLG